MCTAPSLDKTIKTLSRFYIARVAGLALLALAPAARAEDVVSLAVSGVDSALRENIQAHLGVADIPCDIGAIGLKRRLRTADKAMSQATRALGYYQASWTITTRSETLRESRLGKIGERQIACWQIHIAVEVGPPVRLETLDLQVDGAAQNDPAFTALLAEPGLAVGEILHHGKYEALKTRLGKLARDRGYFEGRLIEHRLEVDTEEQRARIALRYDSGPRYRFGPVSFGPSAIDATLLARFQPFAEGEPFDNSKLIKLQSNLLSSGYFNGVTIEQQRREAQGDTPANVALAIDFQQKTRYETLAGIGASTDTGPRLSYTLKNRRVNPEGDSYQLASQLSPVQSHLGFQYTEPGQQPLAERLQWSTGIQREETDTAESTSFRAEVAAISETELGCLQTLSLKYLQEKFRIADDRKVTDLLMPGIACTRSYSNNPRYPTFGWRLGASVRGAVREVVSDINMLQLEVDGKVILPVFGGRLLSRAGFGATALDEFSELPASLRFFAGGDNSVRGYGYKDLGPEDSEGVVIGGKHRISASVEYDHRVKGNFALATFYDAGNAFDTEDFTLYHSAGVGLRWLSPIGPIRIDLAFPLKEGGYRVHLSMGPDL